MSETDCARIFSELACPTDITKLILASGATALGSVVTW